MTKFRLKIYIEHIQNFLHFSRLFVCLFVYLRGWMIAGGLDSWLVVWSHTSMVGW